MIPTSLRLLLKRVGRLGSLNLSTVIGGIVAVTVPLLAYLVGAVLACLIDAQIVAPHSTRLSPWVPDLSQVVPDGLSPLGRISFLLAIALGVLVVASLLLYIFYRMVHSAAVHFEVELITQLRRHAKRLAVMRTLSAQQTALIDCLDYHLPRVRASLSRWWRTFPRHAIQFVASVLGAALIQPMLTLLTLIATALVALIYRLLDRQRRTSLPVVRERASQQRERLAALSLYGPLLESVHDEAAVEQRFDEQLMHYRKDAFRSLSSSTWKSPTVMLVAGILTCLFLFVIAVQILRSETTFSVPGAFTFSLCFVGAGVSAIRLQRSLRELTAVEQAADELERFLALQVEEFNNEDLQTISRVTTSAELEHVTVQDSRGRKLLENVSAVFKPGLLIGVVASQRLQANALVELLLGFGRPVSGRMLVDGILVSDLQPQSLSKCSHWVASDGALVTGSVRENLCPPGRTVAGPELNDVLASARLSEALQQLPDGLETLVTPGDDRLLGDTSFRLGIARVALRNPSLIVLEEPTGHFDPTVEQQTLDAIRGLVKHSTITVVLPQRLSTLRSCDLVVMLHDHKVADTGTHADLLQRNDLYRHLTYVRFNAFRGILD